MRLSLFFSTGHHFSRLPKFRIVYFTCGELENSQLKCVIKICPRPRAFPSQFSLTPFVSLPLSEKCNGPVTRHGDPQGCALFAIRAVRVIFHMIPREQVCNSERQTSARQRTQLWDVAEKVVWGAGGKPGWLSPCLLCSAGKLLSS